MVKPSLKTTRAAAAFFADCVAEADAKPKAHDQLLFHNLLGYHRMALHGSPVPKQANWKDRPGTPKPDDSLLQPGSLVLRSHYWE